jgi:hypothetical protein
MDGGHDELDELRTGDGIAIAWRKALPLGVAAGVALFIGGGVDLVHRHQRAAKKHDAEAAASTTPPGPRFIVGVTRSGAALTVRDARTGAAIGLPVAAPEGQRFQRVAGDGTSFVVASSGGRKITFQRLRLGDDGRPESLTALPKATIPGTSAAWSDLAVTPDGSRVAYVTYQGVRGRVDVVSTGTGARKTWTTGYSARIGSLSWAGDTLAFVWSPVRRTGGSYTETRHEVRTLDTGAPPGDLKASKPVVRLPGDAGAALISHDGKTVVAGVVQRSLTALQAYSTATGAPTGTLWKQKDGGRVTRLDIGDKGKLLVSFADGRVHGQNAAAFSDTDLADTAW